MPARRQARVTLLLATLILLACGDPLAPEDVIGTYALGQSSDQVLMAWGIDTIRLEARGVGTVWGWSDTGPVRWSDSIRFRVVDSRIEMEFICPPDALCVPPPHLVARRVPGGIRLERTFANAPRLFYFRVRASP